MNTISIDTGIREYQLNDKCTVKFNPSDFAFLEKVYHAFEKLADLQTEYEESIQTLDPMSEAKTILELMRKKDAEMREIVDVVFNVPICEALFSDMSMFARTSDGIPIWANLFFAIIEICDHDTDGLQAKANAKVKKYTEKYAKKYHK